MNSAANTKSVSLPVQVATGSPLRIRGASDQSGGWSVVQCRDIEHARQIMRDYPTAELPCWRRLG